MIDFKTIILTDLDSMIFTVYQYSIKRLNTILSLNQLGTPAFSDPSDNNTNLYFSVYEGFDGNNDISQNGISQRIFSNQILPPSPSFKN